MKIAITGGNGFIGSHVAREAVARGHSVICFDHRGSVNAEIVRDLNPWDREAITGMMGDVRDSTAVTELAAHVDGFIHLAAVLGTAETIDNPRPSAEINILGSLNVFEAARQYDLPVVYAGVGNHFMRNDAAGSYTITKTAAEDFTRMYNSFRGSKITTVRPVNAFGKGQSIAAPFGTSKVRKIMPSFICRALLGQDIEVYGGGSQISDCIYVEDVAEVFVTALEYTQVHGSVGKAIEAGPNKSFTVRQIAEEVLHQVHLFDPSISQSDIVPLPMRPGETPGAVVKADVSTLFQIDMSADDFTPLDTAIRKTVKYYGANWLPKWKAENNV